MCDETRAIESGAVRSRLSKMRALIRSSRERIATLRPAWGAYLAAEAVARLSLALDELERDLGLTMDGETRHDGLRAEQPASPPGGSRNLR